MIAHTEALMSVRSCVRLVLTPKYHLLNRILEQRMMADQCALCIRLFVGNIFKSECV